MEHEPVEYADDSEIICIELWRGERKYWMGYCTVAKNAMRQIAFALFMSSSLQAWLVGYARAGSQID
jgi:hypothetical protein